MKSTIMKERGTNFERDSDGLIWPLRVIVSQVKSGL
jgi:hypothetical protein